MRSYAEILREQQLAREKDDVLRALAEQQRAGPAAGAAAALPVPGGSAAPGGDVAMAEAQTGAKRRNRWDSGADGAAAPGSSDWDAAGSAAGGAAPSAKRSRWDGGGAAASVGEAGPASSARSRWDAPTPVVASAGGETPGWGATPADGAGGATAKRTRSRWDETPQHLAAVGATPAYGGMAATPLAYGAATPLVGGSLFEAGPGSMAAAAAGVPLTPEQYNALRWEREIAERNRPLSDEELDGMLPSEGFKVLEPPSSYVPIRTPARKLMATPGPGATPLYGIPEEDRLQTFDLPPVPEGLPDMKPEDYQYFAPLLKETQEEELSVEEQKERKIMRLLLKVKNGTPPQRKSSLRQITDKAREFGAGPLFNQILPLLMSPALEDQERHLLVKVS